MFSATMAPAIEKLTKKYLRNPVHVSIGDVGSGKKSITQLLEFVSESRKKQKLQDILLGLEGPIIVFVNMKKVADVVARHISNMEFRCVNAEITTSFTGPLHFMEVKTKIYVRERWKASNLGNMTYWWLQMLLVEVWM